MASLTKALTSTVGKKVVVGVSGLMLVGFVVTHLLGNLALFAGEETFNAYSESLTSLPGFIFVELGLAGIFVIHILTTISLVRQNSAARPQKYKNQAAPTRFGSAWMIISGVVTLTFLIVHLVNIRFADIAGHAHGVYGVTMDTLQNPVFALLYMAGVVFIGFHLSHGIQSMFRTLGVQSKEKLAQIELAAKAIAVVLSLGFLSLPIYAMVQ